MNKSKMLIVLVLTSVFLAGCTLWPSKNTNNQANNANTQNVSFNDQIIQLLSQGATVQEIGNPNLTLPPDINGGQIEKYFKIGNILLALVLRNSMNVVLTLPTGFTPTFSGVLIAQQGGAQWSKLIEIKDEKATDKNNPYYLKVDNKKLLLTVVDQNGAGSGEGYEKVFALSATDNWKIVNCYYFGGTYGGPETDGDYYAFSEKFSSQTPKPVGACTNAQIVALE